MERQTAGAGAETRIKRIENREGDGAGGKKKSSGESEVLACTVPNHPTPTRQSRFHSRPLEPLQDAKKQSVPVEPLKERDEIYK